MRISGEIDWVQQTVAIPAGIHTITWQYSKNLDSAVGSDCGWVDMVVFTKARSVSLRLICCCWIEPTGARLIGLIAQNDTSSQTGVLQ